MKVFHGVDELRAAAGTHLGHSDWHTITQDQIDAFAATTGDHQWIHVDTEKAAAGPFGSTIAHGFLTLSLLPMLTWQVYKVEGVSAGLNYGANKLRFPSPVPVGSKVRAGVELLEVAPIALGYQVATRVTIEREGGDKPACVVDMLSVVVP
ncbi:MaoC family dehydratase [Nocardioides immobilis]|uniref:MaoC family dehydratase n=1 Tax=Nocardioides immobilis TaxID=2049295 RepID=A0A417XU91_9ACTN|nr:MaoC family dehydratase [Nocardioides immobilis]RHW23913.1 MaoC family dehydratase [Nocardioides immobilis]